jgi:hypothetical protein
MLAVAWALEALALLGLGVSTRSRQARYAGAAFMTLSLGHALILEAPPAALVTGAPDLVATAKAFGAIALALLGASRVDREARGWLVAGGALTLLYLASVAIVTGFQPAAGSADIAILDLSIRQEGQVLLSGFWSLVGVAALIVGLRSNNAAIRNGALGLLLPPSRRSSSTTCQRSRRSTGSSRSSRSGCSCSPARSPTNAYGLRPFLTCARSTEVNDEKAPRRISSGPPESIAQSEPAQRLGEGGAAPGEQVLTGLLLERCDLVSQLAPRDP